MVPVLGLFLFLSAFGFIDPMSSQAAEQRNVLGGPLASCSTNPVTGWFRDGFCRTNAQDQGVHTVCASMTSEFLAFTRAQGNDLSTPRAQFPGLKPGDRWCLCAVRWDEARQRNVAPEVVMEATNAATLDRGVILEHLQEHATPDRMSDDLSRPSWSDSSPPVNDDSQVCPKK